MRTAFSALAITALLLIGVDFCEYHSTGKLVGQLFENRRERLAGAAPVCPEVNHNHLRLGSVQHF